MEAQQKKNNIWISSPCSTCDNLPSTCCCIHTTMEKDDCPHSVEKAKDSTSWFAQTQCSSNDDEPTATATATMVDQQPNNNNKDDMLQFLVNHHYQKKQKDYQNLDQDTMMKQQKQQHQRRTSQDSIATEVTEAMTESYSTLQTMSTVSTLSSTLSIPATTKPKEQNSQKEQYKEARMNNHHYNDSSNTATALVAEATSPAPAPALRSNPPARRRRRRSCCQQLADSPLVTPQASPQPPPPPQEKPRRHGSHIALHRTAWEQALPSPNQETTANTDDGIHNANSATATTSTKERNTTPRGGQCRPKARRHGSQVLTMLAPPPLTTTTPGNLPTTTVLKSTLHASETTTTTSSSSTTTTVSSRQYHAVAAPPKKSVRFGTTVVHEHALVISDHDLECPLQLDWACSETVFEVPATYFGSPLFAHVSPRKLTADERRFRLAVVYDVTLDQVKQWEWQVVQRRMQDLLHEMQRVSQQIMVLSSSLSSPQQREGCHDSNAREKLPPLSRTVDPNKDGTRGMLMTTLTNEVSSERRDDDVDHIESPLASCRVDTVSTTNTAKSADAAASNADAARGSSSSSTNPASMMTLQSLLRYLPSPASSRPPPKLNQTEWKTGIVQL